MREPNQRRGGSAGVEQEVEALTSVGPRRAGSEAERRTARMIETQLRDLGREVEVEPMRVRPSFALTHLVHAVVGVVASVLSVYVPVAGLLLAAAATVSAFGDLTGSFHLVRSFTPIRASQNVVSDEDNGKPGLIVLVAHYDAPLTGMLTDRRLTWWPRALFISLAVITLCAVGRVAGIDATGFTVIQFIPTVVLIALTPVFADTAISQPIKGSADNAAGVAAALQLAESHSERLAHFDLMLLFTGASAHFGLGMREWLKRHRKDLDPEATAVISLDNIAAGDPAHAIKEGPVFASRMHPTLVEVASEAGGTAYESGEVSDAFMARAAGLPTLRVSTTDTTSDAVDGEAFTRVRDFAGTLLERIDDQIGPLLG
jgi:menaquinone-dependent protoporphyrinogen IX oxidase